MPETMIKLFCWIFGDRDVFAVKISPDETVFDLKKAIVAELPNALHAKSLHLWKKEVTEEEKDGLQLSDLNDKDELRATYKVGHYFGYTPPEMKIHIVVRTPESTGEISSSSYLHRLPFPSFMSCSPSSKYHAHHAHHAHLPGISFASLCPAPFKKPKMASSFAIPDSILSDYSMPLIACNTHSLIPCSSSRQQAMPSFLCF
jgi:hypothetical protein